MYAGIYLNWKMFVNRIPNIICKCTNHGTEALYCFTQPSALLPAEFQLEQLSTAIYTFRDYV